MSVGQVAIFFRFLSVRWPYFSSFGLESRAAERLWVGPFGRVYRRSWSGSSPSSIALTEACVLIKEYVEHLGGELKWVPGGAGGAGDWRIELGGRVALVPYCDQPWCELDMLKVPKVENPQASNDYYEELRPAAIWQLVEVFKRRVVQHHSVTTQ